MDDDDDIYYAIVNQLIGKLSADPWFDRHHIHIMAKRPGDTEYLTESALAQAGGIAIEVDIEHIDNYDQGAMHVVGVLWVYERPAINRERPGYATAPQAGLHAARRINGRDWRWMTHDQELATDRAGIVSTQKFESTLTVDVSSKGGTE